MGSELQVFSYKGANVRTVERDSEVWFVAKDVCDILGISKYRDAISRLDDDERASVKVDTPGGMQDMTAISEPGLYALVLSSHKPEAKEFSRWVRHDVLPQVHHYGMYMTDKTMDMLKSDPELFDALARKYAETRQENMELRERLESERPFMILGHVMLPQKGSITMQSAAQFLRQHGIETGQKRLFQYCRDKKLLCSRKGRQWNKPTQKAIEAGLFNLEVSGGFNAITMITPAGMKYLANELASEQYPLLMLIDARE